MRQRREPPAGREAVKAGLARTLLVLTLFVPAWALSEAPALAQAPQPAFYTSQAPGDAWTAGQRVIALTFDDGPGPFTPQILSILEQYHVPATFFEVGQEVVKYPQYTQMVAAAGYPVEDHTWSHPDLATSPGSRRSTPRSRRPRTRSVR